MIVARPQPIEHSPSVVERYELLRAAMLGAALPAVSRTGLVIFLHRGMWAWARTIVLDPVEPRTIPACAVRPSHLGGLGERRTVVHLLAAMAMTITDRRPA
jgi:hypothetical protein